MYRIISFLGGSAITIISAVHGNLSELFIFLLMLFLFLMSFDSLRIAQAFQNSAVNSWSHMKKTALSITLFLVLGAILSVPLVQYSPEFVHSLTTAGFAVPWYRTISWWNTWLAPVVYVLLWVICWLVIALDQPQQGNSERATAEQATVEQAKTEQGNSEQGNSEQATSEQAKIEL